MSHRQDTDARFDDDHGQPTLLARSGVGAVARCPCGHLHLNLEYLTLRFEPDAFRELTAMLLRAQVHLEAHARTLAETAAGDAGAVH